MHDNITIELCVSSSAVRSLLSLLSRSNLMRVVMVRPVLPLKEMLCLVNGPTAEKV